MNERLIPALPGSRQGGAYRFLDRSAPVDGPLSYVLVEKDVRGRTRDYGPYAVTPSAEIPERALDESVRSELRTRAFSRRAWAPSRAQQARVRTLVQERAASGLPPGGTRANRLKLTTREEGLTYLTPRELAPRLGVGPAAAANLVRSQSFVLSNRGTVIPYLTDKATGGLYFYAEAVDSIYTAENAYELAPGAGTSMASRISAPAGALATSFTETLHIEKDQISLVGISQDPTADLWAWELLYAG